MNFTKQEKAVLDKLKKKAKKQPMPNLLKKLDKIMDHYITTRENFLKMDALIKDLLIETVENMGLDLKDFKKNDL